MLILEMYKNSPKTVLGMNANQIANFSGDGHLRDDSESQQELRKFLRLVEIDTLVEYASYCLSKPFTNGPYLLQDTVNEIGRRLGFEVKNGRYTGSGKK